MIGFIGPAWLYFLLRVVEIGLLVMMTVFWLRAMHRSLEACNPVSRKIEAGLVWLVFIPFWGLVWQFICSRRVGESLAAEYRRRGWSNDEDCPGFEIGVVTGIVVCLITLLRVFFWNQIHDALFFAGTVGIGFCMYRHIDRLGAYRERLEKENAPLVSYGQMPVQPNPFLQQNAWPPPQANWMHPQQQQHPAYPPYPQYPNQQQMPPGYAPLPQYHYPPPPQPPAAPDKQNGGGDEYSRWMPKNDPPPPAS